MGLRNSTPKPVAHSEREVVLGCIDGRLVLPHFLRSMHLKSSEFLIRMAGGAAALLTKRDAESCLGQLTDAYSVRPFDRMEIQLHMGCGKLSLLCLEGGEFYGEYDPCSPESLYELGSKAARLVTMHFRHQLGVQIPVTVTVVDIHKTLGLPSSKVLPPTRTFISAPEAQQSFRHS